MNFFKNNSWKHIKRRFVHAYIKNPYGYPIFLQYWKQTTKNQDVLTSARRKSRIYFLKEWLRTYKYRT